MSKRKSIGYSEKKSFNINDKVFAKISGYSPWPAKITKIIDSKNLSPKAKCRVHFYGTNNFGDCELKHIFDYESKKDFLSKQSRSKLFLKALEEIQKEISLESLDDSTTVATSKKNTNQVQTAKHTKSSVSNKDRRKSDNQIDVVENKNIVVIKSTGRRSVQNVKAIKSGKLEESTVTKVNLDASKTGLDDSKTTRNEYVAEVSDKSPRRRSFRITKPEINEDDKEDKNVEDNFRNELKNCVESCGQDKEETSYEDKDNAANLIKKQRKRGRTEESCPNSLKRAFINDLGKSNDVQPKCDVVENKNEFIVEKNIGSGQNEKNSQQRLDCTADTIMPINDNVLTDKLLKKQSLRNITKTKSNENVDESVIENELSLNWNADKNLPMSDKVNNAITKKLPKRQSLRNITKPKSNATCNVIENKYKSVIGNNLENVDNQEISKPSLDCNADENLKMNNKSENEVIDKVPKRQSMRNILKLKSIENDSRPKSDMIENKDEFIVENCLENDQPVKSSKPNLDCIADTNLPIKNKSDNEITDKLFKKLSLQNITTNNKPNDCGLVCDVIENNDNVENNLKHNQSNKSSKPSLDCIADTDLPINDKSDDKITDKLPKKRSLRNNTEAQNKPICDLIENKDKPVIENRLEKNQAEKNKSSLDCTADTNLPINDKSDDKITDDKLPKKELLQNNTELQNKPICDLIENKVKPVIENRLEKNQTEKNKPSLDCIADANLPINDQSPKKQSLRNNTEPQNKPICDLIENKDKPVIENRLEKNQAEKNKPSLDCTADTKLTTPDDKITDKPPKRQSSRKIIKPNSNNNNNKKLKIADKTPLGDTLQKLNNLTKSNRLKRQFDRKNKRKAVEKKADTTEMIKKNISEPTSKNDCKSNVIRTSNDDTVCDVFKTNNSDTICDVKISNNDTVRNLKTCNSDIVCEVVENEDEAKSVANDIQLVRNRYSTMEENFPISDYRATIINKETIISDNAETIISDNSVTSNSYTICDVKTSNSDTVCDLVENEESVGNDIQLVKNRYSKIGDNRSTIISDNAGTIINDKRETIIDNSKTVVDDNRETEISDNIGNLIIDNREAKISDSSKIVVSDESETKTSTVNHRKPSVDSIPNEEVHLEFETSNKIVVGDDRVSSDQTNKNTYEVVYEFQPTSTENQLKLHAAGEGSKMMSLEYLNNESKLMNLFNSIMKSLKHPFYDLKQVLDDLKEMKTVEVTTDMVQRNWEVVRLCLTLERYVGPSLVKEKLNENVKRMFQANTALIRKNAKEVVTKFSSHFDVPEDMSFIELLFLTQKNE